jgi:M6 family metalloprotease-like protein
MLAAVPSGFAQNNPRANQSEIASGKHVQLDGVLEILNKDFKDHAEVSYTLKTTDGKRIPMHFAKQPPTHFLTGDHVQAEGDLSNNTLVLYSGSNVKSGGNGGTTSPTPSTGPLPYTLGTQYTLVMLVNFQDDAVQPYTVADAQAIFSGQVNDFFVENSYGQTSIAPTVVGWYTIPDSVSTCNLSQIATDAQNAAVAAGVNLSGYTRYVYAFPQDNSCGFAGSSNVGGNPSQSWINGNGFSPHTIDHELGHAFGLWHSHFYDCGSTATICSSPSIVEYGDLLDVMGTVQDISPDYHAFQRERLGWLNYGASPIITTVTSSGTYTINPYEAEGTGPKALKILKSTDPNSGAKTWYYLEARQAVGFDSFLTNSTTCPFCYTQNESTGVLFHVGTDGDGNSGDLLDMTPATFTSGFYYDQSLAVGQSFVDSAAGVTVTTSAVSLSGATVQVTLDGVSSPASSFSLTTNQTTYLPGQTVAMTVAAFSGTTPLAGAGVKVTITSPKGRSTTLNGTTGSNGVALLNYKLSNRAALGMYSANANASSIGASSTAGASTTFAVQ